MRLNLTSCDSCGVVLDVNKLVFPKDCHNEDYSVDPTKAVWTGDDWVPATPCPVCSCLVPGVK